MEENPPPLYNYLNASEHTEVYNKNMSFQTVILLDCHEKERVGDCSPLIESADYIFTIDHHRQGKLIDNAINFIHIDYACVGIILYKMFRDKCDKFKDSDKEHIAKCIYTTILNDTNNFMNTNTDALTYKICAELINWQLKPGEIAKKFLLNKTPLQLKFIGESLATIKTYYNNKIVFLQTTIAMLSRNCIKRKDIPKIVKYLKGVKGVEAVVLFHELKENEYRLSLRALGDVNVNKIAIKYDGGGHKKASGCSIKGDFKQIKDEILQELIKQLDE